MFWGFELAIDWPALPQDGRIVSSESRHATIAFLGNIDLSIIKNYAERYKPEVDSVLSGHIDKFVSLPNMSKPRVLCLSGRLDDESKTLKVVDQIKNDMMNLGIKIEKRKWLFHVTVARAPFKNKNIASLAMEYWRKNTQGAESRANFYFKNICLYQSLPGLKYEKLYSYELPLA